MHSRGSTFDKNRSRTNVNFNLFRAEFSPIMQKLKLIRAFKPLKCIPNSN